MSELNLILLGPPGAGKGTQAANLTDDFGLPYLATGDMMRAKRKEDSELGREVARIMDSGGLVADEVVCQVLLEAIEARGDDGFLLDGFPRKGSQADILDRALTERGRSITAVILIEVPDEEIVQRLAGRRQCEKGHVYHVVLNPPEQEGVCDVDGLPLAQRPDDEPQVVQKRLDVYHEETEPLVERYDEAGVLQRFDGTQDPETVHRHIRGTLSTLKLEERL
jgi:adenylate kinase